MPYSQFTSIHQVKEAFALKTLECGRFLPPTKQIQPSPPLTIYLEESFPLVASASAKARSEGIIYPVLLEVRRILNRQISLFSGEDFTVDEAVGLSGACDFLISRSHAMLEIEAPVILIVAAQKADLRIRLGQCIAKMVAAQRFNAAQKSPVPVIYGSVSIGTHWRFLKLEDDIVTIDLKSYPLIPIKQIMGMLIWMVQSG